jgi:uncharacterized membrane protein YfcA
VTGLTIVQAISGSLLGTIRHRSYGNVSPRLVWLMGPPSAIASLVGALVSRDTPDSVILLIFAVLAFTGAVMLLLPVTPRAESADDVHADPKVAIPIAVVLGFFGGMVGIGGIAFIIAALVYMLRVPPRIAIGSSLGIGLFAAVAALIGKAATAQIDPPLAAIVFVSAMVASPVGAALSIRTQPRALLAILSVIVILSAIRIAVTAVTGS